MRKISGKNKPQDTMVSGVSHIHDLIGIGDPLGILELLIACALFPEGENTHSISRELMHLIFFAVHHKDILKLIYRHILCPPESALPVDVGAVGAGN